MVRETRHLWVGNLPDNIREDRIREHFKRYGRVQSVKLLARSSSALSGSGSGGCVGNGGGANNSVNNKEETSSEGTTSCTVAFMDIKSASKAHNAEHKLDDRLLTTEYYEPAAIPSSASPQNTITPTSYSTSSPSTTSRFPNGHGSSEEHVNFPTERGFYERSNRVSSVNSSSGSNTSAGGGVNTVAGGGAADVVDYIRRTSSSSSSSSSTAYHDGCRSRNRDRSATSYRNGPSSYIIDTVSRSHRSGSGGAAWTSYESTTPGGASTPRSYSQNNDTGYTTTPSAATLSGDVVAKTTVTTKKTKSRTPSPAASTTTPRSHSRSRSSSSSSSSSTSRDCDTSSSLSENKRPVAICVKNLPPRSSDTSLKDGLFHEYKKHGKVTWVKVVGQGAERYAIVCFKKPEDVEKALEVSYDKLFFGCKIDVEPYQGYDVDDNDLRPYEAEIDEYHPKATRTLFIGNLEKDVTASDLRKHFDAFGDIIEIDIKKQGAVGSYAFCQYSDIVSVVKAIRAMDGEHLGQNRIKLGFGKSMPTNCVWVDGVIDLISEKYLRMQFEQYGSIAKIHTDREKGQALVFYDQVGSAQVAVNKMRGFTIKGAKVQVDFASRECQESFFEHLDKLQQGSGAGGTTPVVIERTNVEERTVAVGGGASTTNTKFISRYETPTRARTASYTSLTRSTSTTGTGGGTTALTAASIIAQPAAMPSPTTPGSVTPHRSATSTPSSSLSGSTAALASSRRLSRFPTDYYDPGGEYAPPPPVAHYRNYDEYSQGSGTSPRDTYDLLHDPFYTNVSPHSHLDHALLEQRLAPSTVDVVPVTAFAQPELRNLQKERVHLLEQLEECPSSGDELHAPKKRFKLDLVDVGATADVIIEANHRDHHRKVMEVRRLSSVDPKHHNRRPSLDKHVHYQPHSVCKRRKTGGSEGSRGHHYDHSGSESVGGSRPGTPLVDERPEHFPSEPRRVPRERDGVLSLPLPKFAAQFRGGCGLSVAGTKSGANCNQSQSPKVCAAAATPKEAPSPVHVPPPASPPPRPPSLSSNSSDSDAAPPSPSLDERIKSLEEKYEKWSGSRALSAAGGEALAKLDATREKFRLRHNLLDLDLKEVQPSDIVKSVMAKRSVFDEDLKRLENVGEKYEPKEFGATFAGRTVGGAAANVAVGSSGGVSVATAATVQTTAVVVTTATVQNAAVIGTAIAGSLGPVAATSGVGLKGAVVVTPAPKTPTVLSPRSTGVNIPAAKGLQYPFPTHPPVTTVAAALSPSPSTSTVTAASPLTLLSPQSSVTPTLPLVTTIATVPTISTANSTAMSTPSASAVTTSPSVVSTPLQTTSSTITSTTSRLTSSSTHAPGENRLKPCTSVVQTASNSENTTRTLSKVTVNNKTIHSGSNAMLTPPPPPKSSEKSNNTAPPLPPNNNNNNIPHAAETKPKPAEKVSSRRGSCETVKVRRNSDVRKPEMDESIEKDRLEKEKTERETVEVAEKERLDKERREKQREEERQHQQRHEDEKKQQQDNHEKHRRDSNHVSSESKTKESTENCRKEPTANSHHHRHSKDSVKENRDNNVHEKKLDSRHSSSLDYDRSKLDPNKRKERNSLPANVGVKRRLSAQSTEGAADDAKKIKLTSHQDSCSTHNSTKRERRDSKDSTRSDEKSKSKHKNNVKSYDRDKEKHRSSEDRHKKAKLEKQHRKKERDSPTSATNKELSDKDFLARLELRSNEDLHKPPKRKDSHDECKKKHSSSDGSKSKSEERSKRSKEQLQLHQQPPQQQLQQQQQQQHRSRKLTLDSSDNNSDSDEPKKHSIFDIVDDEPAYISMYDKVKARSCKNMQKQEEEKRQEKIKAKFSQLKQSRAKREEKKRSTSWDEDSDSDRDTKHEMKIQKRNKMLIMSSDEDEEDTTNNTAHKKRSDIYNTDSDSQPSKPQRIKNELLADTSEEDRVKPKRSKSRIASDSSEDEIKQIRKQIKSEIYSDNDDVDQGFADSDEKSYRIKKERKLQQQQSRPLADEDIFGEFPTPPSTVDVKTERFNDRFSSADEGVKKEQQQEQLQQQQQQRKKHKKKQKRTKHSLSGGEESTKTEPEESGGKHHDKKKQHSKKEKKRDRIKEERGEKSSKRSKKNRAELKATRDDKMENIFGSLSEDSEHETKEKEEKLPTVSSTSTASTFLEHRFDSTAFISGPETDHETKEEHKKRKEKKRRDKERRLVEEQNNENSMDYADMAKQLEANIKDDSCCEETAVKQEDRKEETSKPKEEPPLYRSGDKEDRKEARERKKKRKKSKEEKQKHHHHHHKTRKDEEGDDNNKSLPTFDLSSSHQPKIPTDLNSEALSTSSSGKEKKRDKFIPGFGVEIDEKLHDSAVKSISSEFSESSEKPDESTILTEDGAAGAVAEKPRVVISQEETEDAVAALLGESFASTQEDSYNEEESQNEQSATIEETLQQQDDEEMRQAVQSLSGADLIVDAKPETPQSEHELQIDTDTEEETPAPVRFEAAPKTPEVVRPKTPELNYFRGDVIKEPPSLTPIKQQPPIKEDVKASPTSMSLPMLPEQNRTVIAQNWHEKTEVKEQHTPKPAVVRTYGVKLPENAYPPLASIKPDGATSTITAPSPLNRLPITPVLTSMPIQPSTVLLPLAKVAHSMELPSESKVPPQQQSKIVVQNMGVSRIPPPAIRQFGTYLPNEVKPEPPAALKPAIIVSNPPFLKVIKEAPPKLVSLSPPQPSIIQSVPKVPSPVTCITPIVDEIDTKPVDTLTSAPSPVIVQTPMKVEEKTEVKVPESKQLAIEKVTDELNLTLKKEYDEEPTPVPPTPPVKQEPVLPAVVEKPEPDEKVVKVEVEKKVEPEIDEKPKQVEAKTEIEIIKPEVAVQKEEVKSEPPVPPPLPSDAKDDKEEFWSTKEMNLDSVIKTLCSADELSDHGSETGKAEWFDEDKSEKTSSVDLSPKHNLDELSPEDTGGVRGSGRKRGRGRKCRGVDRTSAMQTRRGKVVKETPPAAATTTCISQSKRGGRGGGGRSRTERKSSKSESEATSGGDVYEFKDDADESNAKGRPRLILTIKSPAGGATANTPPQPPQPVPAVKESVKDAVKEATPPIPNEQPAKEEFLSPAKVRKSMRIKERDGLRNTVDDTIEDVVRNTVVTRSLSNQKRVIKQAAAAVATKPAENPRKSPRGCRKKDRRASEPSDDSALIEHKTETKSESDITELQDAVKDKEKELVQPQPPLQQSQQQLQPHVPQQVVQPQLQHPQQPVAHPGWKELVLRRVKGDLQEPMTLIDPVTGLLTPMRECEEGRYIPLPKTAANAEQKSVIEQPRAKPPTLKAHVLSSPAAKAAVAQQQHAAQPLVKKPNVIVTQQPMGMQAAMVPKQQQNVPLNINVSLPSYVTQHLSPRPGVPNAMSKGIPSSVAPKPQQMSPSSMLSKQVQKQQPPPAMMVAQPMIAHMKQQQQVNVAAAAKAMVMNNNKVRQQQQMHHGSMMAASPPGLGQARLVGKMEPPKIDVGLPPGVMQLGQRAQMSPQGPRHAGIPAYEASLHGERSVYNRSRSPPPAHQNSPSPQGDAMTHFTPGAVPLRPPHDLPAGHYMHPANMMSSYPFLRQTYHLPRSPMVSGGLEKPGDGQEGEEAPITSPPPLELRRPGSVGLALAGRTAVVPHSLHSPHDRTTDSPQVGQVYNMHGGPMQHYHSSSASSVASRYYEQAVEPPPAHRPVTSHPSLTALANDRSAASHLASLGASHHTTDRALLQPDRPLSSHSALAAHMGAMGELPMGGPGATHLGEMGGRPLGAAGNIMGAVARHVGADAPTSQRGVQAATPPHASQVPPQAESLFMLLKQYPCMWQGLLALKNDQAAVQMYFVSGNDNVAKCSLPKNNDGSTPPLRIFQRMRLEPSQVEGVARKMQMENEHCMLLALPCGHDHMDVLKQSTNLTHGFITYLQQKQAAGIVNVAAPGTTHPAAFVVHIFPSCDFVNENLRRIAPSLLERVADIAHLLIVITTV